MFSLPGMVLLWFHFFKLLSFPHFLSSLSFFTVQHRDMSMIHQNVPWIGKVKESGEELNFPSSSLDQ